MHRPDYEIYTFSMNGIKYWAFDVEYFGHYVAKSKADIERKVERIKLKVQLKLEEIERENQAYFERIAAEQEKTNKELHAAHMQKKKMLQ